MEWLQPRNWGPYRSRCAGFCGKPTRLQHGEGRCPTGRNGQEHRGDRRGMGPGTWGRTRGDNVGKDPLPAGAGSNLQRSAERGTTEGGGRDRVWRMSPSERRRRGNALRGGARHHPGAGNARVRQRGSGHLAVPGRSSDAEPRGADPRSRDEPMGKPKRVGVDACQRLSHALAGKAHGGKAKVRTGLGKSDRPGSQGGLGKRGHGGTGIPPRNRKGGDGNPPPNARAPELYPDEQAVGPLEHV
jgi:hypothetical protein